MACGDVLSLEDLQTAKKHQIFEAEVITGKAGGVAGGATIDTTTNQVTGQVQKTMPAILRDLGFQPASFDFVTGGTLATSDRNKAVLWPLPGGDGDWYHWEGALPKTIPAASTPYTTGGVAEGAWRPVGDITLRGDLAASSGASLIGFIQSGYGAVARIAQDKLRDSASVRDFGVQGNGADESAGIIAMLAALNYIYIPNGMTVLAKNIQLNDNSTVIVDGTLKLPNGCADFDRLIYGEGKTGVSLKLKEIDGNAAGQSGNIGTHLIYLTNCPAAQVDVKFAHDHYIASGAAMPSVDGIRNASSGGIYLYRCHKSEVNVGLLDGWGREGIYLEQCDDSTALVGHVQGRGTTEYSGVQIKGNRSKLLRASVDNAGASGVGFDVVDGIIENIISTNTRENHGVNFGHPGFPASGTRGSNIVVDGCWIDGIKVSASTVDISIDNFAVKNAGRFGVSVSDSSVRGSFSDGVVSNCGRANIQVSGTEIQANNVRYVDLDARSLTVTMASGTFADGETITAPGGKSGSVRKVVKDLANQEEILFLSSVTGTFVVGDIITGGASTATATVSVVATPVQRLEQTGGIINEVVRRYTGTQDQIRFIDGTAIMTASFPCDVTIANTLQNFTTVFSSNVLWVGAPIATATVGSVSSSGGYTMSQLRALTTTSQITININASLVQTYGIQVIAVGRWK